MQGIYILLCYVSFTTGKWGKQPGNVKPFDNLTCKQLKEEVLCRKMYDIGSTKQECKSRLNEDLKGVRVPFLLLNNPKQDITTLNLKNYTITS